MRRIVLFYLIMAGACNSNSSADRSEARSNLPNNFILELNPKSGSSYKYDIKSETILKMEVDEKKLDKINRTSAEVDYRIRKDSLGDFIMQIKYDKIHVYTKNGEEESDVDAANATYSINALERMLGELRGATLESSINSSGEIKSVKGYNELGAKLISEMTGTDMSTKKIAQTQWDKTIGEGVIKKNIKDLFAFVHDSSIRVGDSWKVKSKQESEIPLTVVTEYELKDLNSGVATLAVKSEISSDSGIVNYLGTEVTVDLKGKEEGEYRVDVKTGMLIHFEANSKVGGKMNVLGREFPITLNKKREIIQMQN